MSHDIQENARTITDLDLFPFRMNLCERVQFYFSINLISRDIELFDYARTKSREAPSYLLRTRISSVFSDKLTIV